MITSCPKYWPPNVDHGLTDLGNDTGVTCWIGSEGLGHTTQEAGEESCDWIQSQSSCRAVNNLIILLTEPERKFNRSAEQSKTERVWKDVAVQIYYLQKRSQHQLLTQHMSQLHAERKLPISMYFICSHSVHAGLLAVSDQQKYKGSPLLLNIQTFLNLVRCF